MTDANQAPEWPREIWAAERDEYEPDGRHVFSEFATVPRWEGDRDCEFHRYIDADIFDSADKYWRERHAATAAKLNEAEAMVAVAYEDAADACANETWHHEGDDAYSRGLDRGAADQASACAAAVRDRTPDNARTALNAMLTEARNKALEEAAEKVAEKVREAWDWPESEASPEPAVAAIRAALLTGEDGE